ncbi:MAG: ribosome maturation factor RimM [Caldisericia bacterium]|jgi:16S rRNA processing protein RimM|nr:ribosome maturation factor RimM [Caldisericia bacterium]
MNKFITIGEIVSLWGVSPSFVIKKETDNPNRFKNLDKILVQIENEEPEEIEILEIIDYEDRVIVKLKEKPKDSLENYIGRYVVIKIEELQKLKEDEYYIFQLMNLDVYDLNDKFLGKVTNFISNPSANDVIVVKNEEKILIPFMKIFIKEINLEKNYIKLNKKVEEL